MNYAIRLGRALCGALAALAALLALLRAPTHRLWLLRVGLTEWGHYAAPLAVAGLLRPWRRFWGPAWPALGAAGLALLSPLLRGLPIARRLPGDLEAAFGDLGRPARSTPAAPLALRDLLLGAQFQRRAPERLVYAAEAGAALELDFYRASAAAGPAPLVIVVHGGGWESGDSSQLADLNHYLAGRGYCVAAIGYRLAPRHPFPAAYDDLLAALAFLKREAPALGADAERIALLGRSAGGQLALLAAYRAHDPALRGVIALYAPTDLRFGYAYPADPRVIDSRGVLERFLGGTPDHIGPTYDTASPIHYVGPYTVPTLLIHGSCDDMVSPANSRLLARLLAVARRPHYLLELPWATHGCDANLGGPSGQLSRYAIEYFLDVCLRAS